MPGLLAVGSVFVGTMEGCAALIERILAAPDAKRVAPREISPMSTDGAPADPRLRPPHAQARRSHARPSCSPWRSPKGVPGAHIAALRTLSASRRCAFRQAHYHQRYRRHRRVARRDRNRRAGGDARHRRYFPFSGARRPHRRGAAATRACVICGRLVEEGVPYQAAIGRRRLRRESLRTCNPSTSSTAPPPGTPSAVAVEAPGLSRSPTPNCLARADALAVALQAMDRRIATVAGSASARTTMSIT